MHDSRFLFTHLVLTLALAFVLVLVLVLVVVAYGACRKFYDVFAVRVCGNCFLI